MQVELLPPEPKVRPVKVLCDLILSETKDQSIIVSPKIGPFNPLGGHKDVESGPYEDLLLASFNLMQYTITSSAHHIYVSKDRLAELMIENNAKLIAVTYDLKIEALIESIARKYAHSTGKSAHTFVKQGFGPPTETDYQNSKDGVGTIARMTAERIKRVGELVALGLWEQTYVGKEIFWEQSDKTFQE